MTPPRVLIRLLCPVCRVTLLVLVARRDGQPGLATIEQRACAHGVSAETDAAIRAEAVQRAERVGK